MPPALPPSPTGVTLRRMDWASFQRFLVDRDDLAGGRIAYDQGTLEIVSPSYKHERLNRILVKCLDALAEELGLDMQSAGSTTFKRTDLERGIEPDNCFYFTNAPAVRENESLDLAVDPPPDLALEIEVLRKVLDRLKIYASLGVPELWRYDGQRLQVLRLEPDGGYATSSSSGVFPQLPIVPLAELLSRYPSVTEIELVRRFREWVRRGFVEKAED